ncbi:putative aminopeptidase YsdC [bioreactor metagenome]|uniref:Putative aminopeptidase YsdC n=1 Tax=bioreactor metagenome TaxID=1076179 RepID=A0A645EKT3_9ZZZZ
MDEVGLLVTYITDDGFLKFSKVGGIQTKVLLGRTVKIGKVVGVIGVKPIHLLDSDKKTDIPETDELYIDIGTDCKEDAEKLVSIGDPVTFDSAYFEFGQDKIKSKAIDDRLGCAMMLKMIKEPLTYDAVFTFVVQEEIGCRGAGVAANRVQPDYAIVLESTTASDIAGVENEKRVCLLGDGPVVTFMDKATVYSKKLYDRAFSLAKTNHIPIQTKTVVAGGNDAGVIHKSGIGVKTIAVSVPCRYLHSPSCVIDKNDAEKMYELTKLIFEDFANDCLD